MSARRTRKPRGPRITPFGAAGEVTGSCYLVETDRARLLLECGLFQGGPNVEARNRRRWPVAPDRLDAVVLSHAHLDHSGLVPKLVRDGYEGPVYATRATCDLLAIMWQDAAHLQERDAQWENKWRRRAGKTPVEPLYGVDDAQRALTRLSPVGYHQAVPVAPGVTVRYHDAGHILGSAIVAMDVEHGHGRTRLAFSGDLGNSETVLLRDPEPPPPADLLLLESTYGDRNHRSFAETREQLAGILAAAHEGGGNVVIPAFAVGRTQELLYVLGQLEREGRLPQAQVFLDSPMAIAATRAYERHASLFDPADRDELAGHGLAAWLPALRLSETAEDSMAINRIGGGAVIIAGSGMCTGGRIRHHLKYNLWRREAHVVICGFQAARTPGRALVDGARKLRLLGADIAVHAAVHTLGGFSAHAGQDQLVAWATTARPRPRLWLVHGEPEASEALAARLERELQWKAEVAAMGEAIPLVAPRRRR
jgi:metallo-beta-lactamase family protein